MLFGFMAQGQLLFVSRETTLSQVIFHFEFSKKHSHFCIFSAPKVVKNRYSQKAISQKKQWKNLMNFLRSGNYIVAYPKVLDEKPNSSCCDHHAPKDPKKDAQKNEVESLFSRIEKEMGVDTTSPLSKEELNLALTSTVIKTNSSVHQDDDRNSASVQKQRFVHGHDHSHDHGHQRHQAHILDEDDDYDMEFADSQYNSYYERYHGAEEDDQEYDETNANAYYNQQDDEESLLRSRKL